MWWKLHKSIYADALAMRSVKSTVLLIVSLAVLRFIRLLRKSHDYNVIIVSEFPNEASCIYRRQGIPSSSLWADSVISPLCSEESLKLPKRTFETNKRGRFICWTVFRASVHSQHNLETH